MTYNELLLDAIRCEEEKLAYSIYWLIKNGILKGSDYVKPIDWDLVNHDEVKAMRERNELNMNIIRLYSIPLGNNQHFLVFAANEEDAKGHCFKELNRIPNKIFDITDRLDTSFWFEDKQKYQSLRELRDEILIFPATAMIFQK